MESTWMHVGNEPQLFVDSALIECTQGLTRRWYKPQHVGDQPVICADQSWEQTLYFTYSNYVVLRDPADGLIKCWYEDLGPLAGLRHPWRTRLLYAESEDGFTFRKPKLDVCPIDGKKTNIVMGYVADDAKPTALNPWANVGVHSNGIAIDPTGSDPQQRFRTIFSRATGNPEHPAGVHHVIQCACSPDGIHWKPYDASPTLGSSGSHLSDVSCLHYDRDARMFVQNTRHGLMYHAALPDSTPNVLGWFSPYYPHRNDLMNKRRVYQTRSHDFLHWSDLVPVSTPDDINDNLDEAHYGMAQFRVGRQHFGLLGILRFVDGEMDVRLLHSRDGIHFQPADRGNPFLTPRGEGYWDKHMVSITSPPIESGDDWIFYHGGTLCHHDWWMSRKEVIDEPEVNDPASHVKFCLGAARLRKEGFASLDGSRQRLGYVRTKPVMSSGEQLIINARCRPGGSVRVAALDADDQPLASCTADACDPFTGDSTAHTVTWAGKLQISANEQWRKLYFLLDDAELFSWRFA